MSDLPEAKLKIGSIVSIWINLGTKIQGTVSEITHDAGNPVPHSITLSSGTKIGGSLINALEVLGHQQNYEYFETKGYVKGFRDV